MSGEVTQGRATTAPPWEMEPGDYSVRLDEDGERVAWVVPPVAWVEPGVTGAARLKGWTLTEHDDGTISTSPSILAHATHDAPGWHGYLERGVWRSC